MIQVLILSAVKYPHGWGNLLSHTEYPRDGLFIFVEIGLLSLIHGFNYVPHLLSYALSLLLWQGFIIIIINLG